MKTKEEISDKVEELITKNMDVYHGFLKASKDTDNMHLRDYLIDEATARKGYAEELLAELKTYNPEVDVKIDGSLSGSLRQSWIDLKTFLTGSTDKSILKECLIGGRASAEEYEEFLKDYSSVCPKIDTLVIKQLGRMVSSLDNEFTLENIGGN